MALSNVCVVVVSFNTKDKLRRCLSAIEPEHEVVVVDNASNDGSTEMVATEFPSVLLVRNSENLGFGRANNVGMDRSTRPLILFLNSDCYAHPGSIEALGRAFEDPQVVAAGGKLLNLDGSLQESVAGRLTLGAVFLEQTYLEGLVRKVLPNLAYWKTRIVARRVGPVPVEQVMGACLIVRPVERFDERFFLYCEDTDLCHRLSRHGKIVYLPHAPFTHELGSSSAGSRWRSVARYNYGKELFFRIHHGQFQSFACLILDRFGALLRMIVWLIRLRPEKVGLFGKVLTCPISGPSDS